MTNNRAMRPVLADNGPWPLHHSSAARAAEARALAQSAPHALMERAGLAVAKLALALAPHARCIDVVCGPGNNGGDGLVAARHLHAAGKTVRVALFGDPERLPADAAAALRAARAAGVPITDAWPAGTADVALDALLGLGARRAPTGAIAAAIARLNALRQREATAVLAVDLPSGLDPDCGTLLGTEAVRADATIALLALKPGLHTALGRDHAGAVWFDDLGVDAGVAGAPTAWLSPPARLPVRAHAVHKGSFGDVAVVGGAAGMSGAAWLAARAALAAGAGRVYASLLDRDAPRLDTAHPELMTRERWWEAPAATLERSTVVCGCGGAAAVALPLPRLLRHAGRLVLDADAFNAIAADAGLRDALAARSAPTILTPHPLEAARLLGTTATAVQADRFDAARRLAAETGAVVVLKGSGTLIAAPGRPPFVNPSGNALLASAGTGDVLAGWLGGLWSASVDAAAQVLAAAAVWQHGAAADRAAAAGRRAPLVAPALIDALQAGAGPATD